ncbi:MAG: TatD family hydrolase [Chitinispirillaceae bacterium]
MIDAHCHLQDERFSEPVENILERASKMGVTHVVCCGTRQQDWEKVYRLASEFRHVVAFFGVHPWFAGHLKDRWRESLEGMLDRIPSGVGEIGLDFTGGMPQKDVQISVAEAQLRIAAERKLPVSIHCRKGWGELIHLLDKVKLPAGGLVHGWSGSAEMIHAFEKRGMYISFGGSITRKGNIKAQRSIAAVSKRRLLLETDSPDMIPEGVEGNVNQPSNLAYIIETAALLRGTSPEQVDELTSRNARAFLKKILLPLDIAPNQQGYDAKGEKR